MAVFWNVTPYWLIELCSYSRGSRLLHQGRCHLITEAGFSLKMVVSYQNTHPLRQTFNTVKIWNLYPIFSEPIIFFLFFVSNIFVCTLFKNSSIIKKNFNKIFCPHLFRIFVSEKPPRSWTKSADLLTPTLYKSHLCCIRADASSLPALRLLSGSNSSDLRKRQVRKVTDDAKVTSVFCRIIRFDILSVSVLL